MSRDWITYVRTCCSVVHSESVVLSGKSRLRFFWHINLNVVVEFLTFRQNHHQHQAKEKEARDAARLAASKVGNGNFLRSSFDFSSSNLQPKAPPTQAKENEARDQAAWKVGNGDFLGSSFDFSNCCQNHHQHQAKEKEARERALAALKVGNGDFFGDSIFGKWLKLDFFNFCQNHQQAKEEESKRQAAELAALKVGNGDFFLGSSFDFSNSAKTTTNTR